MKVNKLSIHKLKKRLHPKRTSKKSDADLQSIEDDVSKNSLFSNFLMHIREGMKFSSQNFFETEPEKTSKKSDIDSAPTEKESKVEASETSVTLETSEKLEIKELDKGLGEAVENLQEAIRQSELPLMSDLQCNLEAPPLEDDEINEYKVQLLVVEKPEIDIDDHINESTNSSAVSTEVKSNMVIESSIVNDVDIGKDIGYTEQESGGLKDTIESNFVINSHDAGTKPSYGDTGIDLYKKLDDFDSRPYYSVPSRDDSENTSDRVGIVTSKRGEILTAIKAELANRSFIHVPSTDSSFHDEFNNLSKSFKTGSAQHHTGSIPQFSKDPPAQIHLMSRNDSLSMLSGDYISNIEEERQDIRKNHAYIQPNYLQNRKAWINSENRTEALIKSEKSIADSFHSIAINAALNQNKTDEKRKYYSTSITVGEESSDIEVISTE
mmetsp:Transcript_23926/g.54455  ORF Transcript_23926/g.54455 Transcript_23926/m.54455 type:complete len:438 (-) Transcript_23926:244-1557(-)